MGKRVVLAGLLGGVAMFMWMSLAHVVLPIGETGVQEIANERTQPWDPDAIFDVLSDHSLAPIGLCAHGTGDPRREETVASVVMQPRAGGLHARKGRTCERVTRSFVLRREDPGRAPSTGNRHRCENRGESA